MFAKGGHKQLSDDEIRRLVDYMLQASGVDQPLLLAAHFAATRWAQAAYGLDASYDRIVRAVLDAAQVNAEASR